MLAHFLSVILVFSSTVILVSLWLSSSFIQVVAKSIKETDRCASKDSITHLDANGYEFFV